MLWTLFSWQMAAVFYLADSDQRIHNIVFRFYDFNWMIWNAVIQIFAAVHFFCDCLNNSLWFWFMCILKWNYFSRRIFSSLYLRKCYLLSYNHDLYIFKLMWLTLYIFYIFCLFLGLSLSSWHKALNHACYGSKYHTRSHYRVTQITPYAHSSFSSFCEF